MNKEFLQYTEALELKELGFDEPCFGHYQQEWHDDGMTKLEPSLQMIVSKQHQHAYQLCTAPLYQQAFRFFREKYKLHHQVTQYYGEHFFYKIEDMVHPRRYEEYPVEKLRNFGEYTSQEDAELACLIKLIEIVKDENKRL
jgi:hypothetical protein